MTYASEVLADSPYTYLKLNETSGGTAADSSGNSRNGTYVNSPTLGVTGLVPTSADLAASFSRAGSQYLFVADDNGLDGLSAITVEAWIQPVTNVTSVQIAARDGTTANRSFQFSLASGKLTFIRIPGSIVTATGGTTLVSGTIYHVVAVYNGTDIRLYVNGVLDNTPQACTGSLGTSAEDLRIGSRRNSTPTTTDYFNGVLDEVAVYTTALSAARVAAHYAAGTSTGASGSGSLGLLGSGAAAVAAAGAGALSLSGSGSASAPVSGSGALSLSGAGSSGGTLAAAGTGALSISGSGTAPPGTGAGSGDLALSGSGAAAGVTAGSGALTLSGSGAAAGAVAGAGALALSGSGDDSAAASGAAALVLSATGAGTGSVAGSGSGSLNLTGIQASPASSEAFLELGVLTAEALALYLTDLTNALNGRRRRARGTATVGRAVAPLPPGRTFGTRYDKALAYPVPTMVDGRPT